MAKRTTVQRENDLMKTASLYLSGVHQNVIAEQLGVSQPSISNDLKELQKRWKESSVIDINERKSQELAKIDNLEVTYWEAWNNSLRDQETNISEKGSGAIIATGNSRLKVQKKTVSTSGDPAFLRGIEWCIEKRCKIFGLDAPNKSELDGTLKIEQVLTPEEREARIIAIIKEAELKMLEDTGE